MNQETIPAPIGLKLIIRYRLAKAALELAASGAFFGMGANNSAAKLADAARVIQHHATEAWSGALAERLIGAATARHVLVVAMALLADGLVSLLEAWALHRRFVWGRWLVVITTASLIPFEVRALMHHFSPIRIILLVLNVAIVAYLVVRGDGAHRMRAAR